MHNPYANQPYAAPPPPGVMQPGAPQGQPPPPPHPPQGPGMYPPQAYLQPYTSQPVFDDGHGRRAPSVPHGAVLPQGAVAHPQARPLPPMPLQQPIPTQQHAPAVYTLQPAPPQGVLHPQTLHVAPAAPGAGYQPLAATAAYPPPGAPVMHMVAPPHPPPAAAAPAPMPVPVPPPAAGMVMMAAPGEAKRAAKDEERGRRDQEGSAAHAGAKRTSQPEGKPGKPARGGAGRKEKDTKVAHLSGSYVRGALMAQEAAGFKAAGVMPWRVAGEGRMEVLMGVSRGGQKELFGGKRERGETAVETAVREFDEESNRVLQDVEGKASLAAIAGAMEMGPAVWILGGKYVMHPFDVNTLNKKLAAALHALPSALPASLRKHGMRCTGAEMRSAVWVDFDALLSLHEDAKHFRTFMQMIVLDPAFLGWSAAPHDWSDCGPFTPKRCIVCKHHSAGQCTKGSDCHFMHGPGPSKKDAAAEEKGGGRARAPAAGKADKGGRGAKGGGRGSKGGAEGKQGKGRSCAYFVEKRCKKGDACAFAHEAP
eukprot:TRINITY_DN22251_c0_g1_i1.p1 TRINITY_DN22251_c0_g1~~TRINITY_DN22251_c0_g1_i1.p1  ORF type:complete len:537 (+),score=138.54 TRINITY_DN22251_c0_g1_i1:70-1680(+)